MTEPFSYIVMRKRNLLFQKSDASSSLLSSFNLTFFPQSLLSKLHLAHNIFLCPAPNRQQHVPSSWLAGCSSRGKANATFHLLRGTLLYCIPGCGCEVGSRVGLHVSTYSLAGLFARSLAWLAGWLAGSNKHRRKPLLAGVAEIRPCAADAYSTVVVFFGLFVSLKATIVHWVAFVPSVGHGLQLHQIPTIRSGLIRS